MGPTVSKGDVVTCPKAQISSVTPRTLLHSRDCSFQLFPGLSLMTYALAGHWRLITITLIELLLCGRYADEAPTYFISFLPYSYPIKEHYFSPFFWWRNWGRAVAVNIHSDGDPSEHRKTNGMGKDAEQLWVSPVNSFLILLSCNAFLSIWYLENNASLPRPAH